MNRRQEKILTILWGIPLFFLSLIFPKSKNIWIFGAWFGHKFSDNSKTLFQYVNQNYSEDISAYWVTKDKDFLDSSGHSGNIIYAFSIRGIYLQLRAKVFVSSVNAFDFTVPLTTPRNFIVQLWHGTSLKKIGFQVPPKSRISRALNIIRSQTIDCYSMVVSSSTYTDNIYKEAFRIKESVLFRAQHPRCEEMYLSALEKETIREELGVGPDQKLWLYLPTHREEGRRADKNVTIFEGLKKYDKNFQAAKVKLIMKPHPYDLPAFATVQSGKNVVLQNDFSEGLYKILGAADGLITDYSSVLFDFSILGLPIVLFPYDLSSYIQNDRDLLVDIKELSKNITFDIEQLIPTICEYKGTETDSGLNVKYVVQGLSNPCETVIKGMCDRLKLPHFNNNNIR